MALIFADGFDHYDDTVYLLKWDSNNYPISGTGRGGKWHGTSHKQIMLKYFDQQISTFILGCAAYQDVDGRYLVIRAGTDNQLILSTSDTGEIYISNSTTEIARSIPGVHNLSSWNYVEIKATFSSTVGTVIVRVDGTEVINVTDVNTSTNNISYVDNMYFGVSSLVLGYQARLDDLYVCDETGDINNDFLGDVIIRPLYPISDEEITDFTLSSGSDGYALVDDPVITGTSTNLGSNIIGAKALFGMSQADLNTPIFGVQVCAATTNVRTGGTIEAAAILESGTVPAETQGPSRSVVETLKDAVAMFEKEPVDDVEWSKETVNTIKCGIITT